MSCYYISLYTRERPNVCNNGLYQGGSNSENVSPYAFLRFFRNSIYDQRKVKRYSIKYRAFRQREMATHSSILAWRIPWTEEPGRLQSTGSQRVGHNCATSLTSLSDKEGTVCWSWLLEQIDSHRKSHPATDGEGLTSSGHSGYCRHISHALTSLL